MVASFMFYPFVMLALYAFQSYFSLQRSPVQRRGQRAELTMLSCTSILNFVLLGSSLFTTISPETDPTYELPKVVDATTELCEPKSIFFVLVIGALLVVKRYMCCLTVHFQRCRLQIDYRSIPSTRIPSISSSVLEWQWLRVTSSLMFIYHSI